MTEETFSTWRPIKRTRRKLRKIDPPLNDHYRFTSDKRDVMELSFGRDNVMLMDDLGLAILESLVDGGFVAKQGAGGLRYVCYKQFAADTEYFILIQRLFMGLDPNNEEHNKLDVDHLNRNTLDNRLANLRVVDRRTNSLNRTMHRNNTSGMNGVWYCKKRKQYCVGLPSAAYKRKWEYFPHGPTRQWKTEEEAREAAFACRREWNARNGCTNGEEPVQT